LIQAAQHGNLEAFDQLMRGFDWPVLRPAFRITGNQTAARSIHSEAMLRMYGRLAASQPDCSLCLFAYRVVTGLCLEYLRGKRTLDGLSRGEIGGALTSLSPRERIVFELKHYQGLDLRTVSKVLDITEELARSVLLRACQKLRAAFSEPQKS
jgi:RNA polymerase sigma-70 factor (ECF subfamily)